MFHHSIDTVFLKKDLQKCIIFLTWQSVGPKTSKF